jgi:2,4-dienoyl-CoA reductase-like NADH-dependent reductase (Old Yellow Enzyme family)
VVELVGAQAEVEVLGMPLELGCGIVLKNRLAKAAMSDSLGDGAGDPTDDQVRLYARWAAGGAGLSIIGEVQVDPRYPENPGNLVLGPLSDRAGLRRLVHAGSTSGARIWPQLGHAGALAYAPISRPAGPSAMDVDGSRCDGLSRAAIEALPGRYAAAARLAQDVGFGGVEVHAGHGFLLSQFLSPLFNRRTDRYGGPIEARCQILLDVLARVRRAVGSEFAVAVRVNSSDQLEGGLTEDDALAALALIGNEPVDLIDISGGTYVPGAVSSSDRSSSGPSYLGFAERARTVTSTPLMLTGGFKTRGEAAAAVRWGAVVVFFI